MSKINNKFLIQWSARLGFQQNIWLFLANWHSTTTGFKWLKGVNLHVLWSLLQCESVKLGPSCEGKKLQDVEMIGTGPSNLVFLSFYTGCWGKVSRNVNKINIICRKPPWRGGGGGALPLLKWYVCSSYFLGFWYFLKLWFWYFLGSSGRFGKWKPFSQNRPQNSPPTISPTLCCTSLKFCKVSEILFKVSENTKFVKNLLYGYYGNCLITWCFSLIIVKTSMKNRSFSNAPRNHQLEGVKIKLCVMIVMFL